MRQEQNSNINQMQFLNPNSLNQAHIAKLRAVVLAWLGRWLYEPKVAGSSPGRLTLDPAPTRSESQFSAPPSYRITSTYSPREIPSPSELAISIMTTKGGAGGISMRESLTLRALGN